MKSLTLANVRRALAAKLGELLDQQIADLAHPDRGAVLNPAWGLADPGSTATLVSGCILLCLAAPDGEVDGAGPAGVPPIETEAFLQNAILAADYLLRAQRPSGLIDLRSCNYDSGPDTGFAVQRLALGLELARSIWPGCHPGLQAVVERVETFVRRAVPGMIDGGFHTPNHRWVIASALAQTGTLFPDLPVAPAIDAYLAEGFDVDAEGAYIERSVGVYDATCNRSLLLLADLWHADHALDAVRANLALNLYLLHGDGTAETGMSRRQDYGTRTVPIALAAPYLYYAQIRPEPQFVRAAQALWARAADPGLDALNALCYVLLKYGDPPHPVPAAARGSSDAASSREGGITGEDLPDGYARLFPLNGIWRARRGPLSVSAFRGTTRLVTLCYGRAALGAIKINQSYFGVGRFVGDTLTAEGDSVTLRSEGRSRPNRPGYDLPLGRPVPPEEWGQARGERGCRPLPPATSTLTVTVTERGLELRYRTLGNLDGVTAQVALDFAPGGIWETEDTCFCPRAGQVIFMRRGHGSMRYGNDVIRVGPGAEAHRMWQMRDAETAPGHVRVLLTFVTPVDHAFAIACYHSPTEMPYQP